MKKSIFLLFMCVFVALEANADAVEIDGIYYNLVSKLKSAEVTKNPHLYSGEVIIPESVEYKGLNYDVENIGDYAFQYCYGLTSITIPNSITSIGENAFQDCTGLTSINIPNSVTSIGENAFQYCTGLTSINIPNSVTSLGDRVFSGCNGLASITISNSVTSIGENAFYNCSSLTSISIPNSVTSIGDYAFQYCNGLTSITIPNSVTSIGWSAFYKCSGLTSVTIPNSVTSIGGYAFYNCSRLTSIMIGSGVGKIYSNMFASCPEITDVYCYAEKVPNTDSEAFKDSYIEYATLHVPAASVNDYKSSEPWKNFKSIVDLDGNMPETQKCATPVIVYENGKLMFACATEGVEYVADITCADIKKHYSSAIDLTGTYTVSVYATKTGYDDSDVATKEIKISGNSEDSGKRGDLNNDGEVNAADAVTLVNILMNN